MTRLWPGTAWSKSIFLLALCTYFRYYTDMVASECFTPDISLFTGIRTIRYGSEPGSCRSIISLSLSMRCWGHTDLVSRSGFTIQKPLFTGTTYFTGTPAARLRTPVPDPWDCEDVPLYGRGTICVCPDIISNVVEFCAPFPEIVIV